ncbi:MAG TPA: HAD family phosphatase [Spirochaetota bacterium]|nr:HAD family phosphatase [Spirochaetota bacterium]HOS38655.1 HAD family phosphatase [Spirochaetota bacterium]HPU87503.1 HAD family phosphatase [Spirochaetota bacterium]
MSARAFPERCRAVLFDMDGVIVDSMPYHADAWMGAIRECCGLELSREDIFRREGMPGITSIIDILSEKNAPIPDEAELVRIREAKLRIFEHAVVRVFPGVADILAMLAKRNIARGLVTGSMRRSVRHLLPPTLRTAFQAIVTGDDIRNGKPHPEPYLSCLARLGVDAAQAIAVENAPMGIRSARGAGLACVAIRTTLDETHLSEADAIVPDHDALRTFLEKALGA